MVIVHPDENNILKDLDAVISYTTHHTRRSTQISFQDHAETIASRLQCSKQLMQDDLTAEQLRMDILKSMPQCLTVKRLVKSKLHKTVQQRSKKSSISYWRRLKYKISYSFRKVLYCYMIISYDEIHWYISLL